MIIQKTFSTIKIFFVWVFIFSMTMVGSSCQKDKSCETCTTENSAPTAVAGTDQTIQLPVDSLLLDGTKSRDPDGSIKLYRWREVAGPAPSQIAKPTDSVTRVRALLAGLYEFELTVMDDKGLSSSDTIAVTVNPSMLGESGLDIYVAGNEYSAPKYWKNGHGYDLKIANFNNGHATDITVDGDDVYVTGWEGDFLNMRYNRAKYWKNSQENFLTGETGAGANAIAISGDDVFVAGWELKSQPGISVAKYWKNGVAVALTDGTNTAEATGIAVVGGEVYVSGYDGDKARVWKNGQLVRLASEVNPSYVYGMFVSGSDVYLAGMQDRKPAYWKNGQVSYLSSAEGRAGSVFVSGTDVYVAGELGGYGQSAARYWKNGQEVVLSGPQESMIASRIFVVGNDVFVAGFEYNMKYRGGYWKNAEFVKVGSDHTQPSSIVVKRR